MSTMVTTPQEAGVSGTGRARRRRTRVRAATVVSAIAFASVVWLLSVAVLGIDVRTPPMGGEPAAELTLAAVVVATGTAALAAFALLAALERFSARPRRYWLTVATIVLALSLGAPTSASGIGTSSRVVLCLLHLVVGAVLMIGAVLTSGSSAARERRPRTRRKPQLPATTDARQA